MLNSTAVFFQATENIVFRTYETEALHGLIFSLLAKVNPSLTTALHDSAEKAFTLSNFMPFTRRDGAVKVLTKGQTYKFRITFFEKELLRTFLVALTVSDGLQLNGVPIVPTQVLANDAQEPWCGQTTFEELLSGKASDKVTFHFLTTTSFRKGDRNYIIPTPEAVFGSLQSRWELAGGPKLQITEGMTSEIEVSCYNLKSRREQFSGYSVKGFTGECEYWFGSLPSQAKRELMALARFAFYGGVGYKTTMGLGQVKIKE